MDELIRELKKRDMKLMMDLVVNHTSDQVGEDSIALLIRADPVPSINGF